VLVSDGNFVFAFIIRLSFADAKCNRIALAIGDEAVAATIRNFGNTLFEHNGVHYAV
jgi:hypothetical protein